MLEGEHNVAEAVGSLSNPSSPSLPSKTIKFEDSISSWYIQCFVRSLISAYSLYLHNPNGDVKGSFISLLHVFVTVSQRTSLLFSLVA